MNKISWALVVLQLLLLALLMSICWIWIPDMHFESDEAEKLVKREMNFISLEEHPSPYYGDVDDLPEKVVLSTSGTVVTVGGTPYLWRPRPAQDVCYKACQNEVRLECIHYYFHVGTKKCFMVGKSYTKSVFQREELPELFFGGLNDIPKRVRDSLAGTVVTYGGVSHVWRARATQVGCYTACKDEKLLMCIQYFFDATGLKCFLMGKINTKIDSLPGFKQVPKPFKGKLEDIPQRVLESASGMAVTFGGIAHMWRPRASREDCYNACRDEELIDCVSYYFSAHDLKCVMMDKRYTKLENLDSLELHERPPWLFMGKFADLPTRVLTVTFGSVVTVDDVPYSLRRRFSRKGCYTVCKEETRFECLRYYYHADDHKCITIGKKKPPAPIRVHFLSDPGDQVHQLKKEVKKIKAKVTSLESEKPNSLTEIKIIHNLEAKESGSKRHIEMLAHAVRKLNAISPRLVKKVLDMDKQQEALGLKVKHLATYQKEVAAAMSSVADKVTGLDEHVVLIGKDTDKLAKQITGEEFANPDFQRDITAMRRQLMDLQSKVEINPTLVKLKKNQRVLGQALEAIEREITVNERRLGHITDSNDDLGGRLIREEENRKILSDAIQTLAKALRGIRNDVMRLQSPQSPENAERANQIRAMKLDVEMLHKSHAKLEKDMTYAKTDLSRLVKDLLSAQVSSHETKNSVLALVEANKRLKMEYRDQEADMRQMMMKIQVMATVYKHVLNSLHGLEHKQIKVMHHLGKFEDQIHRLSSDVLKARQNPLIRSNPVINSMKTFQMKLSRQVNQLKQDLLALQSYLQKKTPQTKQIKVSYKT